MLGEFVLGLPGVPEVPGELEPGNPPALPANTVEGPPELPPVLPPLGEAGAKLSVKELPLDDVGTDVGRFNGAAPAADPPINPTGPVAPAPPPPTEGPAKPRN